LGGSGTNCTGSKGPAGFLFKLTNNNTGNVKRGLG
jgi:hypothetical protein